METKKKTYTSPETEVTHVEIESSICGGSVEFGNETNPDKSVVVDEQSINTGFGTNNNFSSEVWDMGQGS